MKPLSTTGVLTRLLADQLQYSHGWSTVFCIRISEFPHDW